MTRTFILIGSLYGLLGVVLGAFAAHGSKATLPAQALATFEVGVRYQMYHALALLAAAWAHALWPGWMVATAGWLFAVGVLIFSGSLYIVALTSLRWAGAIAPIGGAALIAAWLCLALAAWRAGASS